MRSALVHGCIRFEVFFNVQLVFLLHQLNFFWIRISFENFVKVSSHTVLLVVEPVEIAPLCCVYVLR